MKITTGEAYSLYIGLKAIGQEFENVAPTVRLNIGININRLQLLCEVYERTLARAMADLSAASAKTVEGVTETPAQRHARETKLNIDNSEATGLLRAEEQEVELKTLKVTDLSLAENPKVLPTTLAQVMPILEGVT